MVYWLCRLMLLPELRVRFLLGVNKRTTFFSTVLKCVSSIFVLMSSSGTHITCIVVKLNELTIIIM